MRKSNESLLRVEVLEFYLISNEMVKCLTFQVLTDQVFSNSEITLMY